MKQIRICRMTKELARQYFRQYEQDPMQFMDMSLFQPYVYSDARSDAQYQRQNDLCRVYLAVMLDQKPIGEVIIKNIDRENHNCTLSISLQNDSVKNHGYGTQAEMLALEYAFGELEMLTVYADAVHKNKRRQHVLEKVGFRETHADDIFRYYRCDHANWQQSLASSDISFPPESQTDQSRH